MNNNNMESSTSSMGSNVSSANSSDASPPRPTLSRVQIVRNARVSAILEKLESIRPDIEFRAKTIEMFETVLPQNGRRRPGYYGWLSEVTTDNALFYALLDEIAEKGQRAMTGRLRQWEHQAEELRLGTLSQVEKDMDKGWENCELSKLVEDASGLFGDWNWADATAKPGPGLDDEVDPCDVSGLNTESENTLMPPAPRLRPVGVADGVGEHHIPNLGRLKL